MSTKAKTSPGTESARGTAAIGHFCYLCQKSLKTASALSSHKAESHDGRHRRIYPLKCQWCYSKPMMTRKGLSKHMSSCQGVSSLHFPLPCPCCGYICEKSHDLLQHSINCELWEQDTSNDEQVLADFDKELVQVTRHPAAARYTEQMFEKAELRLEDGERAFAFIISHGSKRFRDGSKAHVRIVKRRVPEVIKNTKLDSVLASHAYGRLVCLEDYRLLDNKDPIWHLPFPENGESLARMLEGLLIQSGDDVLLALKVEFGLEGDNAFRADNVYHDHTHKVMISTVKWCVLATLAVMLTDGTVVVGPDNKVFCPKKTSRVWIKKDPGQHLYNTMARQLRSKFNDGATFALYSAVHPLLNHHTTMPVTLRTLYGFKTKNAWSGVKVAAFVFHQLYTQRKIVKAEVQIHVEEALVSRKGKSCENLDIVKLMIQEMAEVETFPVSKPVNTYLTELASNLSGEITKLNNTDVMDAVAKKIKNMVSEAL
ncbi:hypothetical protein BGX27_006450 [Mortierella sp. AM989]|nr:hypothetical protein BGX27_006450 [Mortierella sp. AM989]